MSTEREGRIFGKEFRHPTWLEKIVAEYHLSPEKQIDDPAANWPGQDRIPLDSLKEGTVLRAKDSDGGYWWFVIGDSRQILHIAEADERSPVLEIKDGCPFQQGLNLTLVGMLPRGVVRTSSKFCKMMHSSVLRENVVFENITRVKLISEGPTQEEVRNPINDMLTFLELIRQIPASAA
jgi:hypothetical protein